MRDAPGYGVAGRLPRAIQQRLRPPSRLADGAIARVLPERMASPDLKVQRIVNKGDHLRNSPSKSHRGPAGWVSTLSPLLVGATRAAPTSTRLPSGG